MNRQWVKAVLLAMVAQAVGCAGVTRMEIEHLPEDGTVSGRVPKPGEYRLWKVRSFGNEHQLAKYSLKKGEVLGFDAGGDELVAVAGQYRYPLEPGWYKWYRVLPRGEHATDTSLSVTLGLVPFMLIGVATGGG